MLTVTDKSDGMFRYAALLLEELTSSRAPEMTVQQKLSLIPPGLGGIYIWILEHLNESYLMIRKKIFIWLTIAARPVTVAEMSLACITQDGEIGFDPSTKAELDGEYFLTVCGPLVEITSADTLQFTHFSVKEFLLGNGYDHKQKSSQGANVTECFILDRALAHTAILQTCSKFKNFSKHY